MPRDFSRDVSGLDSPLSSFAVVTKDDSNDLPGGPCRAVIVDADGTINAVDIDGVTITGLLVFKGVNPYRLARIKTGGSGPTVIQVGR